MYRRSIRLQEYDYAQDGAYFVTLLTYRREHLFGDVSEGEIALSTLGCAADTCWLGITDHFPGVELDAFVVMPNHLHGIVVINRWQMQNQSLTSETPDSSEPSGAPAKARHDMPHVENTDAPVRATLASP